MGMFLQEFANMMAVITRCERSLTNIEELLMETRYSDVEDENWRMQVLT